MNDWIECIVGDVAAPTRNALVGGPFGSNLVSKDYVDYGVPVIRGQNMGFGKWVTGDFVFVSPEKARELAANIARPGDLVFTQRGTLGQVAIVPDTAYERYIVSQSQMKLTVDSEKADAHFLYYYFSTSEQQEHIRQNSIQTGVPHTNLTILRNTPLYLPPPPEQRAIARILGSLDDKIEANRRMNTTLEETARAMFKSWFVDFDPVYYKSRGEQPVGMDAGTAVLFPDRFDENELGLIPSGWLVGTVGHIADFNVWTLSKKDKLDLIEYIEISEVMKGEIGTIKTYVRGEEPSRARRRLQHGDTVVSTVRPDRGAYFLCLNPSPLLMASTGFAVFTPKNAGWSFLHSALIRPEIFERLGSLADGAAYPAVAPEMIAGLPVVIPSSELMTVFHTICAPLYEQAEQNRAKTRTLAETRDALLPKLIRGELRVNEFEDVEELL